MVITYYGGQFVRITQGDTVIAVNPFSKQSKRKPIHFGARIGLVSLDDPNYNGVENLSHGEKQPFVVNGPGEYEVSGIAISGFLAPKPVGEKKLFNTIYTIELEGVRLCIAGALASSDIPGDVQEGIGEIDVLFVPISGGDVLSPADAEKFAVSLDAKVVIPLGWETKDDKQLKLFLKEAGAEGVTMMDRFTFKRKDLEGKEGDVVLLEPMDHA